MRWSDYKSRRKVRINRFIYIYIYIYIYILLRAPSNTHRKRETNKTYPFWPFPCPREEATETAKSLRVYWDGSGTNKVLGEGKAGCAVEE